MFKVFVLCFPAKDVEGFQGGDLTKLEQERICFNFTEGSPEKKEFYSPNYPNNYPNNTKCELQLKGNSSSALTRQKIPPCLPFSRSKILPCLRIF